ncbi:MAG: DUF6056 family protein [Lachnospiraceae bacterium]|nr:DUF6056 family protein [Lachnospiraceae bacterium]
MNKKIALLVLLTATIFFISLLPILATSYVNRATGDDISFSVLPRQAWVTTNSLTETVKASFQKLSQVYDSWQGTWFSIFLFTLQPEVFNVKAYLYVTPLIIAFWVVTIMIVMYHILVKLADFDKKSVLIINFLFLLVNMQFIPGVQSALFWYNGIIHYQLPFLMSVWLLYLLIILARKANFWIYLGITLIMVLLGGSNYLSALFAFLLVFMAILFLFLNKQREKAMILTIPLVLQLIGLYISMRAPGNKIRGGEEFGFSLARILVTVWQSLTKSIQQGLLFLAERPLAVICLIFILFIVFYVQINNEKTKRYPYPGIFLLLTYGIYAAMYAPEIYSGSWVSQGVDNIYYQVFLLFILANGIYFSGYLANYYKVKKTEPAIKRFINYPSALIILIILCLVPAGIRYQDIKDTVMFQSFNLIYSGRAAEYKRLMDIQTRILLDEEIKDAIMPGVFEDYSPLMNLMAEPDPNAFYNIALRDYYGKKSVVAIGKNEWFELYGGEFE